PGRGHAWNRWRGELSRPLSRFRTRCYTPGRLSTRRGVTGLLIWSAGTGTAFLTWWRLEKGESATDTTDVHVLSGASGYQTFLVHEQAALGYTNDGRWDFRVARWDADDTPDLIGILKNGTGTGTTEVHVLSGASGFDTFLLQTGTALNGTDFSHNALC